MTDKNSPHRDVNISIDDNCLSLTFKSAFGELSFSVGLTELEAQVSRIVTGLVERIEREDPNVLAEIAMTSGVSTEDIKKSLERLSLGKETKATRTAIDEYIGNRNLDLRGAVEQIIDNLPDGLEIMLTHLALATIVRAVPDVRIRQRTESTQIEDELFGLLRPHFKTAINQLWET